MQRKDVKADGTVYADKVGRPLRIVETERLWDHIRSISALQRHKRPSIRGHMSTSTNTTGYTTRTYTGFLAVRSTLATIADLENLDIRPEEIGDGAELDAWSASLPEGLFVDIVVSREIQGTYEDVTRAQAAKVEAERVGRERVKTVDAMANAAYSEAKTRLAGHGMSVSRHVPTLGSYTSERVVTEEAYVILRASELIALLDRLESRD